MDPGLLDFLLLQKITQSFLLEVKIYQFIRLSISSSNINAEYSYKFFGFGSKTMPGSVESKTDLT
jgi:hypothetical protein